MAHADDLARMRAEMDQAKEGVREFAGAAHAFYGGCREAGFGRRDALALTQTFLATVISTAPISGMVNEVAKRVDDSLGEDA